jgi:hypothetical protein
VLIERHGDRAHFRLVEQGPLTVTVVLETFLANPHAFPQCLLARCLPQLEHDQQPCTRRCRRTDARNAAVGSCAGYVKQTFKRRNIDPFADLQDLLRRLPSQPADQVDELLPAV